MSKALKPCPFCGGKPDYYPSRPLDDEHTIYHVECDVGCEAEGPHVKGLDGAVEAWNRRATGQTEREATEPSEAMVERAISAMDCKMLKAHLYSEGHEDTDTGYCKACMRIKLRAALTPRPAGTE